MKPRALAVPLLALLLAIPSAASAEDPARRGPPAFVPLEHPAVAAALVAAARLATEGRTADAVEAYQAVADGPLAERLAALPGHPHTLEQARERVHRELARKPELRAAHRKRYAETADALLRAALGTGDERGLRAASARFPLTDAGARAALLLARAAHRRGDPGDCLGILERLRDLHGGGAPPAVPPADLAALEASAALASADADGLAAAEAAAAPLGKEAVTAAGVPLAEHLAACRAALPAPFEGPRGPLDLLWSWSAPSGEDGESDEAGSYLPVNESRLPAPADRVVAVAGGLVYWADRLRVTALDLETGEPAAMSSDVSGGGRPLETAREIRGETFGPAADARGAVAALDLPDTEGGRRAGSLVTFDRGLRRIASRGTPADLEHPEMRRRFLFHGPPVLHGDRVFAAATEAGRGDAGGDVRTHVLAFRRDGLEPLWDTFVAYGSGIHVSSVAPAGPLVLQRGRLYFASHTGLVACLEARSGAVLWARRYYTPEMAPTPRLGNRPDQTMAPVLWHHCPPAVSGELVAFAPRDSYTVEFLRRRPTEAGTVLMDDCARPRRDSSGLTTLWVVPGPAGSFWLGGEAAGAESFPLLLRSPEGGDDSVRAPLQEPALAGLPVRTADSVYAITEKALYRVPSPGKDGAVERLAAVPGATGEDLPRPGNLVVLSDRVLSVSDEGILCFGRKRAD